jgi:hypothetical protein
MFLFLEELMMKKFKVPNIVLIAWISVVLLVTGIHATLIAQQVNGRYTAHYANGRLKEKGFYKQGAKHKTWYYYTESGLLDRKEKWQNGVVVWQIYYNEKGKVSKRVDRNGNITLPAPCNCN